ncbi:hypothetical protein C922_04696 [Plasmodium inui San Antonio 1]|uniref:Uncharacterized protein n=1 Tax=Plasmodium inui San Antonio 1 TaxID=1237626 RepID=W7A761_9APIC|nr:hypothetical protein C922_04696 [Plasmodium inui San Antonio 1]EUD64964.1 hypothetical protein C922_04696 [Plasmodium inui San Antonio 1]
MSWELTLWKEKFPRHYYPRTKAGRCSEHSKESMGCYNLAWTPGKTDWTSINNWSTEIAGDLYGSQSMSETWTHQKTGLWDGTWGKPRLTWTDFIDLLLQEIDKLAENTPERSDSTRWKWYRDDWYSALKEAGREPGGWNSTSEGQAIYSLIFCIVSGLYRQGKDDNTKLTGRDRICTKVDQNLEVEAQEWLSWYKQKEERVSKLGGSECTKTQAGKACTSMKLGLINSVYEGLTKLCPTCGPYQLGNWIRRSASTTYRGESYYCVVNGKEFNCNNEQTAKDQGRTLVVRGIPKTPSSTGQTRAPLGKAQTSAQTPEESSHKNSADGTSGDSAQAVTGLGGSSKGRNSPTDSEGEPEHPNVQVNSEGGKEPEASASTTITQSANTEPQKEPKEAASSLPNPGTNGEDQTEGPPAASAASDSMGAGGEGNATSALAPGVGKEEDPRAERGIGTIAGGVIGGVLIAGIAAYGLYRIWGRPRRRKALRADKWEGPSIGLRI